jgi:hypothetical protein
MVPSPTARPGSNSPPFRVLCDDNFERGDESVPMGEFADYESAVDKCRMIVEHSLRHRLGRQGSGVTQRLALAASRAARPSSITA